MRSRCPQPLGGMSPVFQLRNEGGTPASAQSNSAPPLPQMTSTCPVELRTCSPTHWSSGSTKPHDFDGLRTQEGTMSSMGCQQLKSSGTGCTHWSSHQQTSPKTNASSALFSALFNSHSGTLVDETFVTQTNSGQWTASSSNTESGLQQSLNCDFSGATSSAALHENNLECAAQSFPSQYRLLQASLTANVSDDLKALFHNQPCRSEETHGNIEVSKLYSTSEEQACPPPLSRQTEEMGIPTDAQIHDFIKKHVAYFKHILSEKNPNYGHKWTKDGRDSTPESNNVEHRASTSGSNKEENLEKQILRGTEQCISIAGPALEVDSTANVELISKSEETDDCPTSEKNLTEDLQIMEKVVATSTRNEDERQVLMLNSTSSQRSPRGVSLSLKHIKMDEKGDTCPKAVEAEMLGNVLGGSKASEEPQTVSSSVVSMEEATGHSPIKSSVDEYQIHTLVSKTNQRGGCHQNVCGGIRECVHSKTSAPVLPLSNVKEKAPGDECHKGPQCLKVPEFEDISDCEDLSPLSSEQPSTELSTVSFPVWCEGPHDDKISENENPQNEIIALERPGEESEGDDNRSSFENESDGHTGRLGQKKTEIDSDEKLIPNQQVLQAPEALPKTQDDSCSPSSGLSDEDETHEHLKDIWRVIPISISDLKFEPEADQDCPESFMLNDGESDVTDAQCYTSSAHLKLNVPAPKPVQASASHQLPVFDTVESFLNSVQMGEFQTLSDSEEEPPTAPLCPELPSAPEDSCETEDSCDYSSSSERNRLTVPKKRSASPETIDSVSEGEKEERNNEKLSNMSICQTSNVDKNVMQKLDRTFENESYGQHVHLKTGVMKISQKNDVIIIDSDTEDESDQTQAKRTGSLSSRMRGSGNVPCTQQRRHFPRTVDGQSRKRKEKLKNRLPPADSPPPQHYHDWQFEVMQDTDSDEPHTGESRKTQKLKKTDHVLILDSSTEDDTDYYVRAERRRLSSTEEDSGEEPCVPQERHLPETGDHLCGTSVKSKPQLSSEDSRSQPLSVDKDVRVPKRDNNNNTQALKTPKETSKKNRCMKTSKKESANSRHSLTRQKVPPRQDGTSSSSSLSSTSRRLSQPSSSAFSRSVSLNGETSTSCIHPKSKQSTSKPSQRWSSSKFLMHRSVSHPSTAGHRNSDTKSQSSSREAKAKLTRNWEKDFFPTRFDRKSNLEVGEDFRPSNHNFSREAGPGSSVERVPRQRHSTHSSLKPQTPLMKKSMSSAIQWTKAINREAPKTKCPVGEGYKWSQKSAVAKPTKDSGR